MTTKQATPAFRRLRAMTKASTEAQPLITAMGEAEKTIADALAQYAIEPDDQLLTTAAGEARDTLDEALAGATPEATPKPGASARSKPVTTNNDDQLYAAAWGDSKES